MNRRNFVKNLLGSVALVAAVKVGLGNITTEDALPVPVERKMLFDICDEHGKVLQTVEGRRTGNTITVEVFNAPSMSIIRPHDVPLILYAGETLTGRRR